MPIAAGGPCTILIYRKATTLAPNNSPIEAWAFVRSFAPSAGGTGGAWVQDLSTRDIESLSKRGIVANTMITVFSNPGALDNEHNILFTDVNGTVRAYEVRGLLNQSELGRVFNIYAFWDSTHKTNPAEYPAAP